MFDQPSLFEDEPTIASLADETHCSPLIEWSFSRRDLFERCLLWYYYRY